MHFLLLLLLLLLLLKVEQPFELQDSHVTRHQSCSQLLDLRIFPAGRTTNCRCHKLPPSTSTTAIPAAACRNCSSNGDCGGGAAGWGGGTTTEARMREASPQWHARRQ